MCYRETSSSSTEKVKFLREETDQPDEGNVWGTTHVECIESYITVPPHYDTPNRCCRTHLTLFYSLLAPAHELSAAGSVPLHFIAFF
ncbi:hypothetical protein RB195_026452 [Necator americanus]|uniref:Uncharacterized protein n=1 Tax=Necator americanus TaxID=51031 RepID=A0ABR1EX74_NECAM